MRDNIHIPIAFVKIIKSKRSNHPLDRISHKGTKKDVVVALLYDRLSHVLTDN